MHCENVGLVIKKEKKTDWHRSRVCEKGKYIP